MQFDEVVKLILQVSGTNDVEAAADAFLALQSTGVPVAQAIDQAAASLKDATAAAKAMADAAKVATTTSHAMADGFDHQEHAAWDMRDAYEAAWDAFTKMAKAQSQAQAQASATPYAMADALEQEAREAADLAAGYQVLGAATSSYVANASRVAPVTFAEAEAMRAAAAAAGVMEAKWTKMSKNVREYGDVSGTTTGKQSSLTQTITAGSYAFQDFAATSGDLGAKLNSVTNNIPQLLVGLGGLGLVLSVTATAGVAAYRNWDSIAGLWETRNPFPKAAHDVAGLKRELDAAKDSLKKMEEAGAGNAEQIVKYNGLRQRTAEIERQISDEAERQARMKKFTTDSSVEKEAKDRAGRFESTMAKPGQREELARSVESALPRERLDKLKAEADRTEKERQAASEDFNPFDPRSTFAFARATGAAKKAREAFEAQEKARKQEADDLASKAVIEGNAEATDRIKQLQKQRPDKFTDFQRFAVEDADPAKARDEAQFIEQQKHDAALAKALKAKKVALAEQEIKEAEADLKFDVEHQAQLAKMRREGGIDERGRTRDAKGFDEESANRVRMAEAAKEREKAQKANVLPALPAADLDRKFEDRQRAAQVEQYAGDIHRNSQAITGGIQFTPAQARAVSARAFKIFAEMGQFADEQEAIMQAAREQVQGMGQVIRKVRGNGAQGAQQAVPAGPRGRPFVGPPQGPPGKRRPPGAGDDQASNDIDAMGETVGVMRGMQANEARAADALQKVKMDLVALRSEVRQTTMRLTENQPTNLTMGHA